MCLEEVASVGVREGWLLRPDEAVQGHETLGSGSYGTVTVGTLHGAEVALKHPRIGKQGLGASCLLGLCNELRVLRRVRHPNVVLFFGACLTPATGELVLVLERLRGLTFKSVALRRPSPSDVHIRYKTLCDVVGALRFLHAQLPQIVHGDLKPSNVLVQPQIPLAKLLDFGLSRVLTKHAGRLGGTRKYMAPELLADGKVPPKPSADVYSFGRMVHMALTGVDARDSKKLQGLVWPEGSFMVPEGSLVCERSLVLDPDARPTTEWLHQELGQWIEPRPEESQSPCTLAASNFLRKPQVIENYPTQANHSEIFALASPREEVTGLRVGALEPVAADPVGRRVKASL
jgi:serine/threonine protein kinase